MNRTVLIDSDAFVALVRKDDALHTHARDAMERLMMQPVSFLTSNYVFAESVTVISQRVSHAVAMTFARTLKSPTALFLMTRIDEQLEEHALEIFARQTSKNVSFIDCTNMALVEQQDIGAIFSFDAAYHKNGYRTVNDDLADLS